MPAAVAFQSVTRTFPGVTALDGVSFEVEAGECHGVIGENGAGKSTLMKLLAGLHPPTAGRVLLDGQPVDLSSPAAALAAGVAMIHQELNLVDELSVAENLYLGRELTRWGVIDRSAQERRAAEALARLHADIAPSARVGGLSIAQKQLVEIAKALSTGARVLILDEPTAVLGEREIHALFDLLAKLKRDGVTLLYISHHLPEILTVCDRVTVLRDGKLVRTLARDELKTATERQLADLMVGRPLGQYFPPRRPCTGDVVLDIRNVRGVSLQLRRGEMLGVAGLIGAGRTELGEAIAGLRDPEGGTVLLDGKPIDLASPARANRAGIAYLPEDRKATGLTLALPVLHNLTLASLPKHTRRGGFLSRSSELATVRSRVAELSVKTSGPMQLISQLSGGNQQKVALAKWLETSPKVLIVDEPTRGVDVGAKEQIYHLLHRLTEQGLSLIVISSELNELLGLTHRIAVLRAGKLVATLDTDSTTENEVMRHAATQG